MIRRSYDIVDLKLALSGKSKITRGKIRRRRFIEYVYEGIAQLVNYQEYFDFPENAAYAEKEFDVRVKEPTLYLVVGNAENTDENEIRQALLAHSGRKICLINYDTLALNLIR